MIEKRNLLITTKDLENLTNSTGKETGYLFLFCPYNKKEAYSIAKIKVKRKGLAPNSQLDKKIIEYLVFTPDVKAVPYNRIENFDEEKQNFISAIAFYEASESYFNLFLNIVDKKLEFFTLVKNCGYNYKKIEYKTVANSNLLKFGKRIAEISSDLAAFDSMQLE